jgi:very-short-patch-repair endonuclease
MREHTPDRTFRNARELRRRMTNAEEILWRVLRDRQFLGLKFRRQVPIGAYVADFACVQEKLIVECDGRAHDDPDQRAYDVRRDAWLAEHGWRVLRISNDRMIGRRSGAR